MVKYYLSQDYLEWFFAIDTFDMRLHAIWYFPKLSSISRYTIPLNIVFIDVLHHGKMIVNWYSMFPKQLRCTMFIANNVINIYRGFALDLWTSHVISNSSVECLHSWMDKRNWTKMRLFLKRLVVQRAPTFFVRYILHYDKNTKICYLCIIYFSKDQNYRYKPIHLHFKLKNKKS